MRGIPYGYLHLSSTRGKRTRWRVETHVVLYTFCHPEITSPVTCGEYLMVIRIVNQGERVRWYRDDVGHPILIIFWKFLQVLLSSCKDIQVRRCVRFFSARQGRSSSIACGNVMVIPFYRFRGIEVLLTLLMPFLFFPEWLVPLVGILIGRMMFSSNEISVLSLLPFYLQ